MLIRRSLTTLTSFTARRKIMSKASIPHSERTAGEPRDDGIYRVILDEIIEVNDEIRLFRLIPDGKAGLKFNPGQWLDVNTPNTPSPGGFTITSPPAHLLTFPNHKSHLELAIQRSPQNPPAAYLFQAPSQILSTPLHVRVGGSFIFPPSPPRKFKRVVFIAGGVGVNPLMSMLSQIGIDHKQSIGGDFEVIFLYTVREPTPFCIAKILFLERLQNVIKTLGDRARLKVFFTSSKSRGSSAVRVSHAEVTHRRITHADLMDALGPVQERGDVLCYICGVPEMTDEFVEMIRRADGMDERNVLFEKWW